MVVTPKQLKEDFHVYVSGVCDDLEQQIDKYITETYRCGRTVTIQFTRSKHKEVEKTEVREELLRRYRSANWDAKVLWEQGFYKLVLTMLEEEEP